MASDVQLDGDKATVTGTDGVTIDGGRKLELKGSELSGFVGKLTLTVGGGAFLEGVADTLRIKGPGGARLETLEGPAGDRVMVARDGVTITSPRSVKIENGSDARSARLTVANGGVTVDAPNAASLGVVGGARVGARGSKLDLTGPDGVSLQTGKTPGSHVVTLSDSGVDVRGPSGVTIVAGEGGERLDLSPESVGLTSSRAATVGISGGASFSAQGGSAAVDGPDSLLLESGDHQLRLDTGGIRSRGNVTLLGAGDARPSLFAPAGLSVQSPAGMEFMVPGGSFIGLEPRKIVLLGPNGKATLAVPGGLEIEGPGGLTVDVMDLLATNRALQDQVSALQATVEGLAERVQRLEDPGGPA